MKIQALAIFERVIFQCHALNLDRPDRPTLEVDAIIRDGDADGELLLPVPTFMALLGGPESARPALKSLSAAGRLVTYQDIAHIRFPMWQNAVNEGGV